VKKTRWIALGLALTLICGACQLPAEPSAEPAGEPTCQPTRQTVVVYGFSVQQEVITEEILPAFQTYWCDQKGQQVTFQSVFTGSEEIADAIIGGARADVAILSNEQHAVWLRINDWVETDWRTLPYEGTISRSPIVIAVRPGNPLGISDWADLARPGVKVVHPDPNTSGGAQWALLAEYGASILRESGSREKACGQLCDIWANVVVTPASSRKALREFLFGTGDALVTYEQDVLLAQARGATLEAVAPPSTFVSEHSVVIVDRNVQPWEREVVEAFVDFLWSDEVQQALTRYYFRAVTDEALNEPVPEFVTIERPFTVQDLGGWGRVYPEIIHGAWEEYLPGRVSTSEGPLENVNAIEASSK
jgi:sulfate transport system substrate-binding protein